MHYLIIDTCVWGDLLVQEFTLVPKLAQLVEQGKVTIVLPDLIIIEWDRIKNKLSNQLIKKINSWKDASEHLISITEEGWDCADKIKVLCNSDLGKKTANRRIVALEAIIKSKNTILLPISQASKSLAITYALEKKAPFKDKNGMADALIFFTSVEWVNEKKIKEVFFVSSNVTDFSNKEAGDIKNLSPDLAKLVEKNELKFFPVLARLLNEIETSLVTEEEVRSGDLIVDQVRIKDEIFEAIYGNNLYEIAKILTQQKTADELMPTWMATEILKQQKSDDELMPRWMADEILKQQNIAAELAPK